MCFFCCCFFVVVMLFTCYFIFIIFWFCVQHYIKSWKQRGENTWLVRCPTIHYRAPGCRSRFHICVAQLLRKAHALGQVWRNTDCKISPACWIRGAPEDVQWSIRTHTLMASIEMWAGSRNIGVNLCRMGTMSKGLGYSSVASRSRWLTIRSRRLFPTMCKKNRALWECRQPVRAKIQ